MKILVLVSFLVLDVHSLNRDECGVSHIHNYGNRIAGGREALEGEFPWMVSLQKLHLSDLRYHHFCGGTILNKHWILTAAHCVDLLEPDLVQVLVGTNHISPHNGLGVGGGAHFSVQMIIYPDEFSRSPPLNDIALVRISGEINLKASKGKINKICLPEEDYYLTGLVTATGWGKLYHLGPLSPLLLAVDLPVVTQQYCRTKYGYNKISDTVFCAGYYPGEDTCSGDSGGPVIQIKDNRAVIVGIISYGTVCGRTGWPAVYTEVSKYVDWIHNNLID